MLDNVVVRENVSKMIQGLFWIRFIRVFQDITQTSLEDHLSSRGVDEWIKRYKPPPNDRGPPKHNHDKIVSFIATGKCLKTSLLHFS